MQRIENKTFDEERALYGSHGIILNHCAFEGKQRHYRAEHLL